jgi:hypothetical protein
VFVSEADRRVERQVRAHWAGGVRVEGQAGLDAQDHVEKDDADQGEHEHRDGVGLPALLNRLIDTADSIDAALDRPEHRAQERSLALEDAVHVTAQDGGRDQEHDQQGDCGQEIGHRHG